MRYSWELCCRIQHNIQHKHNIYIYLIFLFCPNLSVIFCVCSNKGKTTQSTGIWTFCDIVFLWRKWIILSKKKTYQCLPLPVKVCFLVGTWMSPQKTLKHCWSTLIKPYVLVTYHSLFAEFRAADILIYTPGKAFTYCNITNVSYLSNYSLAI